ncbi:MAG: glycosyltransferase family 39 protein [Isosphaeraceae bacterium]|nr:glycosyltransferase family 39 protein [Isosphaeraceae bacterium]
MPRSFPATAVESDTSERWRPRLLKGGAIVVLALALNLAGNARTSLWDRDEPRYAGCVREMRARQDWVHPTFNAEPRYQKPIFIYWVMRLGVAVGGDNPYGARLVSAVAGAATCLLVWRLGTRIFGPRAGWLAALMLATAPIMVVESKLATTDATLALLLVGCQFCLWELGQRPSRGLAALFWVLISLATLVKGPVGPALIASAGVASWWSGGPAVCWRRLHWRWGLTAFAALTAPWYIAVGLVSNGTFFRVAFGQQVVTRLTTEMEQHGGFPGYYLATSLAAFHPWVAFLPAAILGAFARRREQPAFGFLLGWVIGPLVLLELVQTKMVHYFLPAYPACALLAAWLVVAVVRDEVNLRRWALGRLGIGLLGGFGIGGAVALLAAACVVPSPVRWPCLALGLVIGGGTLYGLERLMSGATERAVAGLVATWAAVGLGVGAWLAPAVEPYKMARVVAERLNALAGSTNAQPILFSYQEPSTIYAMGRPTPAVRTWPELHEKLRQHGEMIAPALPEECVGLSHRPELIVEVVDHLEGFNITKGKTQTLDFVRIRMRPESVPMIAGDVSSRVVR